MEEIDIQELKQRTFIEIIMDNRISKYELERIRFIIEDPNSIKFIPNPSPTTRKLALILDGLTIKYLYFPTIEERKIAVSSNGLAIYHIEHPTDDLKWMAIKSNIDAIFLIKNPDSYMKQYVVERNGYYAYFMNELDDRVLASAALAIYNSELDLNGYLYDGGSEITLNNNREERIREIKEQILNKQLPFKAINLQEKRENIIKSFVL